MAKPNNQSPKQTTLTVCTIFIEVVIITILSAISLVYRQFLTPYTRGFFRNDESIMYPYKDSTVPSKILYLFGYGGTAVIVAVTEFIILKKKSDISANIHQSNARGNRILQDLAGNCYRVLSIFAFGVSVTTLLTNVGKYSIGRLRPHFIDICQPNFSSLTHPDSYITEDICTSNDKEKIMEARVSFPSGHSSAAMYIGVFVFLYLSKRFCFCRVTFIKPTMQLVVLCLCLFTCASRISDYKHHWSDVLAGGLLGTLIAVGVFQWINNISFNLRWYTVLAQADVEGGDRFNKYGCKRDNRPWLSYVTRDRRDESSQTSEDETEVGLMESFVEESRATPKGSFVNPPKAVL